MNMQTIATGTPQLRQSPNSQLMYQRRSSFKEQAERSSIDVNNKWNATLHSNSFNDRGAKPHKLSLHFHKKAAQFLETRLWKDDDFGDNRDGREWKKQLNSTQAIKIKLEKILDRSRIDQEKTATINSRKNTLRFVYLKNSNKMNKSKKQLQIMSKKSMRQLLEQVHKDPCIEESTKKKSSNLLIVKQLKPQAQAHIQSQIYKFRFSNHNPSQEDQGEVGINTPEKKGKAFQILTRSRRKSGLSESSNNEPEFQMGTKFQGDYERYGFYGLVKENQLVITHSNTNLRKNKQLKKKMEQFTPWDMGTTTNIEEIPENIS